MLPILEKNKQDLQKPKRTPKASVTPSNLITPDDNFETEPKTGMKIDPSTGIRPFFSIKAQCLAQTNQISFLKAEHRKCIKSVILTPATLGLWKTITAF
ncbi:hypothetical protein G9A89_008868 [Geosiphon pyriformis]|nr:hypothetical protein G9A89_008868 [Geosiphon pyriformis]